MQQELMIITGGYEMASRRAAINCGAVSREQLMPPQAPVPI